MLQQDCAQFDTKKLIGQGSMYEKIVKACKAQNGKWKDTKFPPNFDSIKGFGFSEDTEDLDVSEMKAYKWVTMKELNASNNRPHEKVVFVDPVAQFKSTEISQGAIGTCYLLASAGSICNRGEIMKRIFLTRQISPYNVYAIAMMINGIWECVCVDAKFAISMGGSQYENSLAFSYNTGNQGIWVSVLEKAWAKVFGGYVNIHGG